MPAARVPLCEREHLVRHVQPVRDSCRPHALGRENHVDAPSRAEVEHRLTDAELGNRGRVATAEGREHGRVGELATLLGVVERVAEFLVGAVTLATRAAPAPAAARALEHGTRGLRVPTPDLLAQLVRSRRHQQHTAFSPRRARASDRVALEREVRPLPAARARRALRRGVASCDARRWAARARAARSVADAHRLGVAPREQVHDSDASRVGKTLNRSAVASASSSDIASAPSGAQQSIGSSVAVKGGPTSLSYRRA